jgi:MtrB/PioB family decaheme-associated outer membrane protein
MKTIDSPKTLIAIALAALLLPIGLPLAAQEPTEPAEPAEATQPAETTGEAGEAKDFHFRVDPLVLAVLYTDVDTDSAKFQEYRDLSSGFAPALHVAGESGDGERTFDFWASNIRRDDARYTLDYGVAGRYGILLDYNKIPHRFGNDGHMLYTRTGPGRLEIADPVQRMLETAITNQFNTNRTGLTFGFLNGLLSPYLATANEIDLGLIRDRARARVDLGSMGPLGWTVQYTQENRKGNRPFGGSFGFSNATEIPEPIDYRTTGAELAGEWNTDRAGLRFGYNYSSFENDVSTLIWDNPWRINPSTDPNAYQSPGSGSINGASLGFADLAPDNTANMAFVSGRAKLGGNWFVNGNASYNVMKQDDPLLPYTLNTSIVGIHEDGSTFDPTNPANLPTSNPDLEVDVLNLNAQAGTRFGDNWGLTFRYRLYDYDNQSRREEFPGYVRFHAVWEPIARITVPSSYTVQDLGAELGWDLARSTRLALGYNRQSWERTFREVENSDEDVIRLSFDTHPVQRVNLRASYEIGDRSIDGYDPGAQEFSFVEPEGVNNLPLLRKYDEAAREYDSYNVLAQVFATEAWTFSLGVTGRNDDYDESAFGLISDEILQYNAEVGFAPGENLNFYLFGHRADRESFQRARQSGATPSTNPLDDWTVDFTEITDTWGLGFNTKLHERWTTDLSANWSKSDGKADLFSPPGGTPDVANDINNYEDIELLALIGRLDYRINPSATAGFLYRYEDYTIDSFLFQGLRNYLPGALLLNPDNGSYQANVFGLNLNLTF